MALDTAFRYTRILSIVAVAGSLLFSSLAFIIAHQKVARAEDRIYILSAGKALEALAGDRKANIPVEARDHIRSFHQYFFNLDPDEKVIESHLGQALNLADGSARQIYESLRENEYYSGVISGNISQEVMVDSISIDMQTYPIYFKCYGTEKILRPTSQTTRNLVTEGWLRNTSRSDNNPHGFLIEHWRVLDNHDLRTEPREFKHSF
ncbi:MAG TPA: conjugative transposon protein TraK [Puia sp.]